MQSGVVHVWLMLNAACIGQAAAWEDVWSGMGRAEGFGGPPKGQVYVGRHPPACMFLLSPHCTLLGSACQEPIWEDSAAAKAVGLMQVSLPAP